MASLTHHLTLTTNYIVKQSKVRPKVALILGSGLGEVAAAIASPCAIAYKDVPHFPITTVAGHKGRILLGNLGGVPALLFDGRLHFYEGLPMQNVAYPVYVAQRLGTTVLIVTNAAGGINSQFRAGDLMIIRDHINMTGESPLRGPNAPELGARFPSMHDAYDPGLREVAKDVARRRGIAVREGVYVAMKGPEYETDAELRLLQTLGADAVGMSTVPEVIAARHAGMRVFGLSVIANDASPKANSGDAPPVTHEEVQRVVGEAAGKVRLLLEGVVEQLRA